jgi:hypothetical protein
MSMGIADILYLRNVDCKPMNMQEGDLAVQSRLEHRGMSRGKII